MMEGVLEATLLLCVCKVTCSVLFCLPAAARAVTAVSLCSCCLLLFTDLVITLFLLYVWLVESWFMSFQLSSDVIALRFSIFLCQAYAVVLLLTPPLIAVELLVHLLRSQGKAEGTEDTELDKTLRFRFEPLSRTVGFLSCCLVWVVSGLYSRNNWMLGQLSAETCLERSPCLIYCLPGFLMTSSPGMEELSWFLPVMVLLLSLTGGLGLLKSKAARRWTDTPENTLTHWGRWKDFVAPRLMQTQQPTHDKNADLFVAPSSAADSIRKNNRAGFVYHQERWFCPGNVALCSYQTGLAGSFISKQKQVTSYAPFLQSNTTFPLEVTSLEHKMELCDYKKTEPAGKETLRPQTTQCHSEGESPCLAAELLTGLVCLLVLCVFPTIISGNILVIFNLEKLLVYTVKLLSAHSVSIQ